MVLSIRDVVSSSLIKINEYFRQVQDKEEFDAPATKLPELLDKIKKEFDGKSVSAEIARAFEKGKEQLIILWSKFFIHSSSDEFPIDLINLEVAEEVVRLPKFDSSICEQFSHFLDKLASNSSYQAVLKQSTFSFKPYPGPIAEFLLTLHRIKALIIKNPLVDKGRIANELRYYISTNYIKTALAQIKEDHLELRKLNLLEFALFLLEDLYGTNRLTLPIDIDILTDLVKIRVENCSGAYTYPEGAIEEVLADDDLITKSDLEDIERELDDFIESFKYHDASEQECLKIKLLTNVFDAVKEISHDEQPSGIFPFEDLNDFLKVNRESNFRSRILKLFEYILIEGDVTHESISTLDKTSVDPDSLGGVSGGASAGASASGQSTGALSFRPELKVQGGVPFEKILPHLVKLDQNLSRNQDFVQAFIDAEDVLDILEEDEKYNQDVKSFFNYVACQIQILKDHDSSAITVYRVNLTAMIANKKAIEANVNLELKNYLDLFLKFFTKGQEIINKLPVTEDLSRDPKLTPKVEKTMTLKSIFPHLKEIVLNLEGRLNLSQALTEVSRVIDIIEESKSYNRDMVQTPSGDFVPKFRAGLENDENELRFFRLLHVEIMLLEGSDPTTMDHYQSNRTALTRIKASIDEYFTRYPQYQELTPYLDTYLAILDELQAAEHIGKRVKT